MWNRHVFACAIAFLFLNAAVTHADVSVLTPRVSVTQEYTDNLFRGPEGEQVNDYITIYSIGLGLHSESQVSGADISYVPSYSYYQKNSDLNSVRHSADFSGWLDLTQYTKLTLSDNYLQSEDVPEWELDNPYTQNRYEQQTNQFRTRLETKFSERESTYIGFDNRVLRSENPAVLNRIIYRPNAGITWRLTEKIGTELHGDWAYVENGDPKSPLILPEPDYERTQGRFRLTYQWDRRWSTYAQYRHAYQNYRGDTGLNYQAYDGTMGLTYKYSEAITASLGGGYLIQDYAAQSDEPRFIVDTDINAKWELKRTIVDLSVRSGYRYADFDESNRGLELFAESGGSVTYQLTKTLSVTASGFSRYSDYNQTDTNRRDWFYAGSARAQLILFRWCTLSGGYTYQQKESSENIDEYVENRGDISITFLPGAYRVK